MIQCSNCESDDHDGDIFECWECGEEICSRCMYNSMTLIGDYCEDCGEVEEVKANIKDVQEEIERLYRMYPI